MADVRVRTALPSDHPRVVAVCDEWWERPVSHILPRLFLDHFHSTSLIAEAEGDLAGFLVGFPSPSVSGEAYVHFAGVAPEYRGTGLAGRLYDRFTEGARAEGRTVVRAVTSPANERSIAFHRSYGFEVTGPHTDYDGPGVDRTVFTLRLGE
ncbi:GNAT family N-acetyltransferase [Nocardiopsis quinghaiensis]|uniref:GNAT family N-acetyltransferase n=1 Tax=Nocardiopsis quinghaiensis TaxID=464995 RepID=UPI001239F4EB|nr:GNAT family N-acetyltransferase [Nocardiopsis quinghaiensis]